MYLFLSFFFCSSNTQSWLYLFCRVSIFYFWTPPPPSWIIKRASTYLPLQSSFTAVYILPGLQQVKQKEFYFIWWKGALNAVLLFFWQCPAFFLFFLSGLNETITVFLRVGDTDGGFAHIFFCKQVRSAEQMDPFTHWATSLPSIFTSPMNVYTFLTLTPHPPNNGGLNCWCLIV